MAIQIKTHAPRQNRTVIFFSSISLFLAFLTLLYIFKTAFNVTPENKLEKMIMQPSATNKNSRTSRPQEMLIEYQKYHSQRVLMEEFENGGIYNRTFVVGLYACPDSAGNRLHEFFNSFLLAMVHNYTLIWKFYDKSTCLEILAGDTRVWCKNINSLESCDELIIRAQWIASYDDWKDKLSLVYGQRNQNKDFYSPDDSGTNIPNHNKVWIPVEKVRAVHPDQFFWQSRIIDPRARQRVEELYSAGTYYLYGMLFHELFPFHRNVKPSANLIDGSEDDIWIVLHSRHMKVSDRLNLERILL
jgi:hypothetical protein